MDHDIFEIGGSNAINFTVNQGTSLWQPGEDVFGIQGTDPATLVLPRIFAPPQNPFDAAASVIPGTTYGCCLMNLPNAEYHALHDVVSCSMLKRLLRSPAHLQAMLRNPRSETASQLLGSAFHCAVLEPQRFADEYVVYPGQRRGAPWLAFKARHADKTILTADEHRNVTGMREAIRQFDALPLQHVIDHGRAEQSIFWTDEATGVRCRIRPDLLKADSPRLCLDLKSIDDARPEFFLRQITRMHYDLQAAMYLEGCQRFCGESLPFHLVAAEIAPPHGIWVYEVVTSMKDPVYRSGLVKFRHALSAYARSLESGNWTGYANPVTRTMDV